jgi:N-acetylmuramoyl-L-alanine amidase
MSKQHTVAKGECLSTIAALYGFRDYHVIYEHPCNALFRERRPNPNIIYPGDVIVIPDKATKTVAAATGELHRFVLTNPGVLLRVAIHDESDQPLAQKPYDLEIEGTHQRGRTDDQGLIEAHLPRRAEAGRLSIWLHGAAPEPTAVFPLKIGSLDPISEATGVQARLNNLCFTCGPVDGVIGPKTRSAIAQFQCWCGLEATGELDADTRSRLEKMHDASRS